MKSPDLIEARMTARYMFHIACLVAVIVCVGCSEEKKREAARLEAQLRGDTVSQSAEVQAEPLDSTADLRSDSVRSGETVAPRPDSTLQTAQPSQVVTESSPNEQAGSLPAAALDTGSRKTGATSSSGGNASGPATMPPYIEDAFTVQIASSPSESYVQTVVDSFLARGYEAYVGTVTVGEKTYYRARVGRYTSLREATGVSAEINAKYQVQSWVDKITK